MCLLHHTRYRAAPFHLPAKTATVRVWHVRGYPNPPVLTPPCRCPSQPVGFASAATRTRSLTGFPPTQMANCYCYHKSNCRSLGWFTRISLKCQTLMHIHNVAISIERSIYARTLQTQMSAQVLTNMWLVLNLSSCRVNIAGICREMWHHTISWRWLVYQTLLL